MSIARALMILGAGSAGYQEGVDVKRRREQEDEDRAFQRETRNRQRMKWAQEDADAAKARAEEAAVSEAGAPVKATPVYPVNDDEGNAMPMTPDQQRFTVPGMAGAVAQPQADAAVSAANAPSARMRRAAGVMRDPVRAAQTSAAADQAELTQQQLAAQRWELDVGKAFRGGWKGLSDFMTSTHADGEGGKAKFQHFVSPDGKKVTVAQVDDQGNPMPGESTTMDNTPEGLATFAYLLKSKTKPEAMVEHFRKVANDRTAAEDKASDNKRADAQLAELTRHNKATESIQMAEANARAAKAGGKGGAGSDQEAPVWDDKADERLFAHYKTEDPTTGVKMYDGDGAQFAKQIGLAASRRFKGDTLQAVGFAIDADNKLKEQAQKAAAESGGKVAYQDALRLLRRQALQALNAPPAPPAAPPAAPRTAQGQAVAAAPPGSVELTPSGKYAPSTSGAAPAPSMAAAVDPAAGTTFEQRQKAVIERQRKMAADPDIAALEAKAKAAIKAGKRAEANGFLEQAKQLRAERYGA